jgi:DNA-binding SARP family transcriptional activator/streptogramin lyase
VQRTGRPVSRVANEPERRYNNRVEFRILGPLEVTDGGGEVSFDAPKQRALLGVLLLHPNEVVSSERLIDELWGERPPATATKVVQTYVSQLRRALGADMIVTRTPGYVMRVDEGTLDAARFRHLTSEGRAFAVRGEHAQADERYREALALWRGPPLADVTFESFARNEVDRLAEERLDTLMDWIDCELALGRHDQLVAELETLVGEHPLRERLRAQLMLALYRAGRQADALAAYQDARRTLVDELGLEPGGELQAVERAILTHDAALEAPARPTPQHPPRRRALRWGVAAAALVAAAVAVGLAVGLGSGEPASRLLPPNSVGFIDAESGRVTRKIPIGGRGSTALTLAHGSVWVCNFLDRTVTRIDSGTETAGHAIPVGGHPVGITYYRDKVWVWTFEGRLVSIDRFENVGDPIALLPEGGTSRRGLGVPSTARITAGGGLLWITARGTTLIRVDPREPESANKIPLDAGVDGPIAFGDGKAWVTGSELVLPVVAGSGIPLSGRPVGGVVRDLAFDSGSLWVISGGLNSRTLESVDPALRRVDPDTTRVSEAPIPVGDLPVALTVAAGSVWVASRDDSGGTIYRVDPIRNQVVDTIAVGAIPTAIAGDADGVWVTVA